jgi:hypothetical protein
MLAPPRTCGSRIQASDEVTRSRRIGRKPEAYRRAILPTSATTGTGNNAVKSVPKIQFSIAFFLLLFAHVTLTQAAAPQSAQCAEGYCTCVYCEAWIGRNQFSLTWKCHSLRPVIICVSLFSCFLVLFNAPLPCPLRTPAAPAPMERFVHRARRATTALRDLQTRVEDKPASQVTTALTVPVLLNVVSPSDTVLLDLIFAMDWLLDRFYFGSSAGNQSAAVAVAGSGTFGFADGYGPSAMFWGINGMALDSSCSAFVLDAGNFRVRKIAFDSGYVSSLMGNGHSGSSVDGIGSSATFSSGPRSIAADSSGFLFVSEPAPSCLIRQIKVATGETTTLAGSGPCQSAVSADGVGTSARFASPMGIAVDNNGHVFVLDTWTCRLRQISISTKTVSTLAGSSCAPSGVNGVGTSMSFRYPYLLAAGMEGSVYFPEDCLIRKVVISSGAVSTFAGGICMSGNLNDGIGSNAVFGGGFIAFASDSLGNLWTSDNSGKAIRHIVIATAKVTTISYEGKISNIAANRCGLYISNPTQILKIQATTPCTAGFYCPSNGTAARVACEPGTFCPQGSSSAAGGGVCQAGSFCPRGSSAPVPCTAGAFCSESGLSAPSGNCTGGVYCPIGSSNQTGSGLCPAGLYCPSSSPAQACTAGYFCSAVGASAEARDGPCAIGAFCPAGSSSATQQPCTAGSFCNATGLSAAAGPCLAGYWCGAGSNSSTQNECAAGSYCVAGSSAPVLCPAGAYCAYAGRGSFDWCPSGTYCRSAGLTAPSNLTCVEGCVTIASLVSMCIFKY